MVCRWLVGTQPGQGGTVGKDALPRPPGSQRNPQEETGFFSLWKAEPRCSDTHTPVAGAAVGKQQGCDVTLGNYMVNGAALMRK